MLFFDVSFLSLCLSLTHTRTHTLSLYITLSLSVALSLPFSFSFSPSPTIATSISHSLSHSESHSFSHSLPHTQPFSFFWLNVQYVINYSFPLTVEDYVHRIGRTGRGGATGISHTFFTDFDKVCFTSSNQFSPLVYFHLNSYQKPIFFFICIVLSPFFSNNIFYPFILLFPAISSFNDT